MKFLRVILQTREITVVLIRMIGWERERNANVKFAIIMMTRRSALNLRCQISKKKDLVKRKLLRLSILFANCK